MPTAFPKVSALPENPISSDVTGMKPATRKVHMSFVFALRLRAPPVSCTGMSDAVSPGVHKPRTPGLTRGRSCIRQPAVRIGDVDRRLRESQQSCRPTELAADLVNPYVRTNEDGFCGNS